MLTFDFSKSGLELDKKILSSLKDNVESTLINIFKGEGEYIFSKLLDSTSDLDKTKKIVNLIKQNYKTLIVAGIGGSSLGARALINAIKRKNEGTKVLFLENIDSESIIDVLDEIEPATTAVNFISRSGATLETICHYLILKEYFKKKLKNNYNKNFFVTTANENSFLGREAAELNYTLIKIPPELVGRYSVLSPVGLIPAGVAGLQVKKIIDGAKAIRRICLSRNLVKNTAVQFSVACFQNYIKGRKIVVIMPYRDSLFTFGEWFAQLWAESLGKIDSQGNPQGQTPLRGIGVQDQHSLLQLYLEGPDDKITLFITSGTAKKIKIIDPPPFFSHLKNKNLSSVLFAEQKATQEALFSKGRPSIGISLDEANESSLGGLIYFFEVATLLMASFLKVNPFNQPAVEEIKKRTKDILLQKLK